MSWEIKNKNNEVKFEVEKVEHNDEWMQGCYVTVKIESPAPINFQIGDYLIYRGERFEINYDPGKIKSAPRFEKGDAFRYENVKFNSLADELTRCDFLDVVLNDNQLHFTGLPKFSFYGGVKQLADRIQANLDKTYGKGVWNVVLAPEFSDTTELNVSVDTIKVSGALEILVNQFKTYYTIKGRTLTIGAAGVPADHLFKYGPGQGLYEIEENAEADQQIVTRLRAFGSTRNLPHRYYNSLSGANGKALIPDNMAVQYLMLPSFPYTTQDPYIDSKNIAALGVREGTIFFDGSGELEEIYPSIEGMTAEQLKAAGVPCNADGALDVLVSAEQMTDNGVGKIEGDAFEGNATTTAEPATFKVTIKDVGFDINDHIIEGNSESPTLSFKSGMLGGRDFEIVECKKEGDNYVLELNRVYDEDIKLWFPYKNYNAKKDDKFVLLNIRMPEAYIKAASQRLLEAAEKWLAKNDYSRSVYAPKIDENFMARQHDAAMASGGTIKSLHDTLCAGMQLLFEDEDLGIDAAIFIDRLTIIEGEGSIPTYEVVLKEEKTVGRLDKMQNQIDSLVAGQGQGSGGYNASQIRELISAYGGALFLSKLKDDSTPYRLGVGSLKTNNFVSGLFGGIGGAIDERGNAEFESAVIRTALTVMELIINRQSVMGGDSIFAEGGTIEKAEYVTTNADGTEQWMLTLKDQYEGEVQEIQPGMVVRGVVNNLFEAANTSTPAKYYTSWMRVNGPELGTQGNKVSVTLYPDNATPAGKNFPPCELMKLARWGHETDETLQRLFYLSSHEGRLVRYEGVNKPIIDFGNIASIIGRAPDGMFDHIPQVQAGDEIAYFKILLGNFIQTDHLGKPIPRIEDTGQYDPSHVYKHEAWNDDGSRFVTEDCWYMGCRWRCMVNGITGVAPGYGLITWAFVSGNPEFKVDFEEKVIAYSESELDSFGATLTLTATIYNQDVLRFIPASNITWGRESYDSHGALRVTSDAAWQPTTDNGNKRLILSKKDFDYDGTPIKKIVFWARVVLDDTNVQTIGAEFQ
ncbi:MAG: hypothetical protein HDS16_05015 [Bacteroides sp.]|nr:hypothetical protein [Bacteroides sp.]